MKPLAAGTRLGAYEILSLLGQGGMGAVYRARHLQLGRTVALKVLSGRRLDEEALARFRREARAAAAISHANVLRVHEANLDGAVAYLVLELAAGGSLADRIEKTGPLPWREAARVGAEVARGLAAVHGAGLVHRDLKPANVLFDESGVAKLSDFGLVRAVEGSLADSERLTATGDFVGTPEFASPEQIDGAKDVGPPSDLFSLGGTLYQALTGRAPFEGRGPSLLFQVLTATPPAVRASVSDCPGRLERLVSALLAKNPGDRPASAALVASELEAIARSSGGGRRRGALAAGVVASVACALVAVVLVARGSPADPGPGPPRVSPTPAQRLPSSSAFPLESPSPELPATAFDRFAPLFARSELFRLAGVWGELDGKMDEPIHAFACSRDGTRAATATGGSEEIRRATLALWDLATGRELWTIDTLQRWIQAVAFSPDGRLVATVSYEGTLALTDAATGVHVVSGAFSEEPLLCVAFSPAGDAIAFGAGDGKVRLWRS